MASVKVKKLDPRLLPFIDAYIDALFSGEKKPEKSACIALGIDYAGQLRKDGVHEEITRRVNDYLSLGDIDKVQILLELKKSAFASIADVLDFDGKTLRAKAFSDIDKDALDSIQSIKQNSFGEVEVKMYSKTDSLDKLSKIFNMQKTTIDVNHGVQKPGLFDSFDPNEDLDVEETQDAMLESVLAEASE